MNIQSQISLNTPHRFELEIFRDQLSAALDAAPIASVRLRCAQSDVDSIRRAAELLQPVCHARDAAFLLTEEERLVEETGADGVHFGADANRQAEARELLGPDRIIGVGCGASRHQGLLAGERGADYVSFALASHTAEDAVALRDLVEWWRVMIELPMVVEGLTNEATMEPFIGQADFIDLGEAIWRAEDGPTAALKRFHMLISN